LLLEQLRAAMAEGRHTNFTTRRLEYAVLQMERRLCGRRRGRLPLIPVCHRQIIEQALVSADVGMILAIKDTRGRNAPEEDKLKDIYEALKKETKDVPSIREIAKRARKEGLHVSRERLAKLIPKKSTRINPRTQARRFVDLSLMHFDRGLTVLGFSANYAPSLEVLRPTGDKMSVMLPSVPSSSDRARILELNRIVSAITRRYPSSAKPDWRELIKFLQRVPPEKARLFYIAGASKIPRKVKDALRAVSAKIEPRICTVKSPNYPLFRMLSREFAVFGAGWFPTLGDTIERLSFAYSHPCLPISLAQAPNVRNQAMNLRMALERKFEAAGVQLCVGPQKAKRLACSPSLSKYPGSTEPSLIAPMPFDFPFFTVADSPNRAAPRDATDPDRIALCFEGVEEVLSALPFEAIEARSKSAIQLQEKFLETRKGQDMLNCAAFFQPPGGNFIGPEFFSALGAICGPMGSEQMTFWSALLLLSFDPDMLLAPECLEKAAGKGRFPDAYAKFLEEVGAQVEEGLQKIQKSKGFSYFRNQFGEDEFQDLFAKVRKHMIARVNRIWKAGLDEATERITVATLGKASRKETLESEAERICTASMGAVDPARQTEVAAEAGKLLERLQERYRRIWPTLTVSRRHLFRSMRNAAVHEAKHSPGSRGKGKLVPGVNTVAVVSAKEKESGSPGVLEEEVASRKNPSEAATPETLEELLSERLQGHRQVPGKADIILWWRRFFVALRLTVEERKPVCAGRFVRALPKAIRDFIELSGQELYEESRPGPKAKKLYQKLEAYFASRTRVGPG